MYYSKSFLIDPELQTITEVDLSAEGSSVASMASKVCNRLGCHRVITHTFINGAFSEADLWVDADADSSASGFKIKSHPKATRAFRYTDKAIVSGRVSLADLKKAVEFDVLYDDFEIEKVGEFNFDGETHVEVIHTPADEENALSVFWTVYGHLPTGGVRALMDFEDEADARKHYTFFKTLLRNSSSNE